MGQKFRKIIIIIAALVFAVSLFMVIKPLFQYHMGDKSYSEAMEIAGIADLPVVPYALPETETEFEPEPEGEPNSVTEPKTETEPVSGNESRPEAEPEPGTEPKPGNEQQSGTKPKNGNEQQSGTEPKTEIKTKSETESAPVSLASYLEMMEAIDLDALRAYNSDVVGWIAVPYTVLSYPVVQGNDNDYYLNHTWDNKYNFVGSIFLEHSVSTDFSDFNTIIYGHRMGNGTMFNSLAYYADYYYWKANPQIYIMTDDGIKCYDVYSTYEASVDSITYAVGVTDSEVKQEFIRHTVDSSVINTGIVPEEDDHILTLSTCTRSGGKATRWVVHAVLNEAVLNENEGS